MPAAEGARFVRLAASVRQECAAVERVVAEAGSARAALGATPPPMLVLRGLGAILHDFYTGIERVLERVATEFDGGVPTGHGWHRELLRGMTLELQGLRPPVLRPDTARVLDEYLRFRHLFRNIYGFELEWPRLLALLDRLSSAWQAARADLEAFLGFVDVLGAA